MNTCRWSHFPRAGWCLALVVCVSLLVGCPSGGQPGGTGLLGILLDFLGNFRLLSTGGTTPDRNVLIMAEPTVLDFGVSLTTLTFEVWKNDTSRSLPPFTASSSQPWVTISPTEGTSTGPTDRVTIQATVDRTGLPRGLSRATISLQAPGVTSTLLDVMALAGVSGSAEIGPAGGTVSGPNESQVVIPAEELTEELGFALSIPTDAEIRQSLALGVPYAGALRIDAWRSNVSAEGDATDGSYAATATIPLLVPLGPGQRLDVYVQGDLPGEWILLDVQARVDESGRTASLTTGLVGVFLLRQHDVFSTPTVNLDAPKTVAKQAFAPALGFGLHKVDDGGFGPIPMILIHDAGAFTETQESGFPAQPGREYARWDSFIAWAKGTDGTAGTVDDGIDLAGKFQLWWFLHDTSRPVGYDPAAYPLVESNALQLADELARVRFEGVFPEADQQFVVIAHGRGGLVARAFMEQLPGAGDQVVLALTLGTPHHGTCLAVPDWAFYAAATHFSLPVANGTVFLPAERMLAGLTDIFFKWNQPGDADWAWDNFDSFSGTNDLGFGIPYHAFELDTIYGGVRRTVHALSSNDAGWPYDSSVLDTDLELPVLYAGGRLAGATLWDLNYVPESNLNGRANKFIRKFILYGGYISESLAPSDPAAFWDWPGYENGVLQALSAVMGKFETAGTRAPVHAANDGCVALQSALYLRGAETEPIYTLTYQGGIVPAAKRPIELDAAAIDARLRVPASHTHVLSGYTHLDLVTGLALDKSPSNDTDLFANYIRSDLDVALASVPMASFFVASREGGRVTIDVSGSHDNDTPIWPASDLEYRIDWGDGQIYDWADIPLTAHIYIEDGTYIITLQVRDDDGMANATSRTVIVAGAAGGGGTGPDMVSVPGDLFNMGPGLGDSEDTLFGFNELPRHYVNLNQYQVGKYEVTNAQYVEVLNWALLRGYLDNSAGATYNSEGGDIYANGRLLLRIESPDCLVEFADGQFTAPPSGGTARDRHPVVEVTWYGAVAYCNWLSEMSLLTPVYDLTTWERIVPVPNGYRLPTEAEWERAAAWDTGVSPSEHWVYGFRSDYIAPTRANYDQGNPLGLIHYPHTTPVGYYNGINLATVDSPNVLGAYDMSGNAWEWCHDWVISYTPDPQVNPAGPATGTVRSLRGGSWLMTLVECRTAFRGGVEPEVNRNDVGFRLAKSAP